METTAELDPRLLEAAAARLEKKARRTYELSAALRSGSCPEWMSGAELERFKRDLVAAEQEIERSLEAEVGSMAAGSNPQTEDHMADDKCSGSKCVGGQGTPQKSVRTGPKGPQGRGATSVRGNTGGKGKAPGGVKKFG